MNVWYLLVSGFPEQEKTTSPRPYTTVRSHVHKTVRPIVHTSIQPHVYTTVQPTVPTTIPSLPFINESNMPSSINTTISSMIDQHIAIFSTPTPATIHSKHNINITVQNQSKPFKVPPFQKTKLRRKHPKKTKKLKLLRRPGFFIKNSSRKETGVRKFLRPIHNLQNMLRNSVLVNRIVGRWLLVLQYTRYKY